jgi:hypothetical protein
MSFDINSAASSVGGAASSAGASYSGGGGGSFDFGSLFGAIAQLGSAGFAFGSNYVAAQNGQQVYAPGGNNQQAQFPQYAPQQKQQESNNTGLIIGVVVFLVILIVIAFLLTQKSAK